MIIIGMIDTHKEVIALIKHEPIEQLSPQTQDEFTIWNLKLPYQVFFFSFIFFYGEKSKREWRGWRNSGTMHGVFLACATRKRIRNEMFSHRAPFSVAKSKTSKKKKNSSSVFAHLCWLLGLPGPPDDTKYRQQFKTEACMTRLLAVWIPALVFFLFIYIIF